MYKNALLIATLMSISILSGCNDDADKTAGQAGTESAQKADRPMTEAELRKEKERRVFNPTPEERAEDLAKAEVQRKATEPVVTQLEAPGEAPDFSEYKLINSGTKFMYLHTAMTGQPLDALALADAAKLSYKYDIGDEELQKLYGEFIGTNDEFTKRDLAKKMEPLMQKHVDEYKGVRYVKIVMPKSSRMSHYDFDKKGFTQESNVFLDVFKGTREEERRKVNSFEEYKRGTLIYSDVHRYQATFSNGPDFKFIKVEDEAVARAIEAIVKTPYPPMVTVYGYVDSVQKGLEIQSDKVMPTIIKIQRLEIADRNDPSKVLLTVTN